MKIERDPEQMMRYSKKMIDSADRLVSLIKITEALLDTYAPHLDDPTQKEIRKLHDCCQTYYNSIKKIVSKSEEIYDKGKQLKIVRDRGIR